MNGIFLLASIGLTQIQMKKVACIEAKTLVRCWHKLHVNELKAHDFIPLIAPHVDDEVRSYRGAVRHDELKAIAVLQDDHFVGVAYDLDGLPSACALVAALAHERVDMSDAGYRWQCEAAFARELE